jgi:hypothetical protein
MVISRDRLWKVQKTEWPKSVWLLPHEMLNWASHGKNIEERLHRYMMIALTAQKDRVMFYVTDPKGGAIGARYGLNPDEYFSGFTTRKAKLVGTSIIDTEEYST